MESPERFEISPVHELYSDDAVRAIGEFFLATSTAEATLLFLLAEIQCHPHPATIHAFSTIHGMQNKVILQKIGDTAGMVAPEAKPDIQKICTKIRAVFEHRNNLAHSPALLGGGEKILVTILKTKVKEVVYTPTQLRGYSDSLYQLVRNLSEALRKAGIKHTKEYALLIP